MSLLQTSKISKKRLQETLEKFRYQDIKQYKKRWSSIRATKPFDIIQADVMDMGQTVKRVNGGFRYYNVIIDVYSRFLFVEPLTNRANDQYNVAQSTINIIEGIKHKYGKYPKVIESDNEYKNNNTLKDFFIKNEIMAYFTPPNDAEKRGTSIVERVIGTLKRMIGVWQSLHNKTKFNDNIQDIVYEYNYKIKHRIIGTEPAFAVENEQTFISPRPDYDKEEQSQHIYNYKIGDKVRISNKLKIQNFKYKGRKKDFDRFKKNIQLYRDEVWTITKVINTVKVNLKYTDNRGDLHELFNIKQNDIIKSNYDSDDEVLDIDFEDSVPPPPRDNSVLEQLEDARQEQRLQNRINRTGIQDRPFGVRERDLSPAKSPTPPPSKSPTPPPVEPPVFNRERRAPLEPKSPTPPPVEPIINEDDEKKIELSPDIPTPKLQILKQNVSDYNVNDIFNDNDIASYGITLPKDTIIPYFDEYKNYKRNYKRNNIILYKVKTKKYFNQIWFGKFQSQTKSGKVSVKPKYGKVNKIPVNFTLPFNPEYFNDNEYIVNKLVDFKK